MSRQVLVEATPPPPQSPCEPSCSLSPYLYAEDDETDTFRGGALLGLAMRPFPSSLLHDLHRDLRGKRREQINRRRREYLAPACFWLFLPPPRKQYILKISKKKKEKYIF